MRSHESEREFSEEEEEHESGEEFQRESVEEDHVNGEEEGAAVEKPVEKQTLMPHEEPSNKTNTTVNRTSTNAQTPKQKDKGNARGSSGSGPDRHRSLRSGNEPKKKYY